MSLQRSRAMRCSSSPIWCLRYMERCRISPLHLFWLDLFLGQLYCGGGESKAKVWTAGERENGEHQIGDLIKSILDCIGVTNVTFRMIQKTHCFFRGGNPVLSYIWYSGAAANVSRLFHVWPPSTRGGWGYHHQSVFVVVVVMIGQKTTVLVIVKVHH